MSLGQAEIIPEVFLNILASDVPADVTDVISRHSDPATWPDTSGATDGGDASLSDVVSRHSDAGGWPSFAGTDQAPPGEPSPFLYNVGPGGLFYWQLGLIGVGVLLLWTSESGGGGRRRR